MKIAFLLPGRSPNPSGGFKVVYEYANRLAARGHEVAVAHPWDCSPPRSLRERTAARSWVRRFGRRRDEIAPWFEIDSRVELPLVPYPRADLLPDAEALVATAWHTADWVAKAQSPRRRGFYLIQGYESWDHPEDVLDTWRLPLRKIVISKWLEELAVEAGEGPRTSRIPNGMNFEALGVDVPPEARGPRVGAVLGPLKDQRTVISTISAVLEEEPELVATTFGTHPRPAELPSWIEYVRLPGSERLRALYNSCAIFLQASSSEGWGLPATEAMACGCALVTVDNGGSRDYAFDRRTALVVSPRQPGQLTEAVLELIRDRDLRLRLARAGTEHVRRFDWADSVTEMERVLRSGTQEPMS